MQNREKFSRKSAEIVFKDIYGLVYYTISISIIILIVLEIYDMSIRFRWKKKRIDKSRLKRTFAKPTDELLEIAERKNLKRNFKESLCKKKGWSDETAFDHHCLRIEMKQSSKNPRALLFLYDSAYIFAATKRDLKMAVKIGAKSGRDVWFPYYPLCTEYSVNDTYDMLYEVYSKMLEEYEAEDIAFLGFGAGAALAVGVCLHNNAQPDPLPMPGLIISSSPICVPLSQKESQKMKTLSKKDILLDASFVVKMKEFMENGEKVADYMLSAVVGNFTDFPLTHFFYGGDELLYSESSYFIRNYKKYGSKCKMHVAKGMCYCYPLMSVPEGKRARKEIVSLLSDTESPAKPKTREKKSGKTEKTQAEEEAKTEEIETNENEAEETKMKEIVTEETKAEETETEEKEAEETKREE